MPKHLRSIGELPEFKKKLFKCEQPECIYSCDNQGNFYKHQVAHKARTEDEALERAVKELPTGTTRMDKQKRMTRLQVRLKKITDEKQKEDMQAEILKLG